MVVNDHEIMQLWEETYGDLAPQQGVTYCVAHPRGSSIAGSLDELARVFREPLGDEYLRLLRRHLAGNLSGRCLPDVPASRRIAAADILCRLLVAAAENTFPELRGLVGVTLRYRDVERGARWMEELGTVVHRCVRRN